MDIKNQLAKTAHQIYFDGSIQPTKNEMGFGFVVKTHDNKVVYEHSANHIVVDPKKEKFSNNVAEYRSLKLALLWCINNDITNIVVKGDSKLVINQFSGEWHVRGGQYRILALECLELKKTFISTSAKWIPRDRNTYADKLSKKSLVNAKKQNNKKSRRKS